MGYGRGWVMFGENLRQGQMQEMKLLVYSPAA